MIVPIIYPYYIPASLQNSYEKSSAVAAGGQATFSSTQLTVSKTGKLLYFIASSSVAIKVELFTVADGIVSTAKLDKFAWNGEAEWKTPIVDWLSVAYSATAGLDGFRVIATNLDISKAADISVSFVWDEV